MRYAILLASLATTLLAAPTHTQRDTAKWTPALAGYFDVVYRYIQEAKATADSPPTCDLSKAVMPVAPTPLPAPDGLNLVHVAIGRGVQVSRR